MILDIGTNETWIKREPHKEWCIIRNPIDGKAIMFGPHNDGVMIDMFVLNAGEEMLFKTCNEVSLFGRAVTFGSAVSVEWHRDYGIALAYYFAGKGTFT